jgi:hypothetical protein
MAQATSISLRKFLSSVQSAVKAAAAKHPKFQVEQPRALTVSYLIRGFPIPDGILSTVTVGETQAYANEIAAHVGGAVPEALGVSGARPTTEGAVLSIGRHVIVGIPPAALTVQVEE